VHTADERFDDLSSVGRVRFILCLHVAPVADQSREPVTLDGARAQNFGQFAFADTPPQVHLPQPILRRDEALGEEEIVLRLGVNVRDAPFVTQYADGLLQSVELDLAFGLRERAPRLLFPILVLALVLKRPAAMRRYSEH